MERKKLYAEITNELLGAFYIYIQNNIEKGINIDLMNQEIKLIELELEARNLTVVELREIGLEFIANEENLVKKCT